VPGALAIRRIGGKLFDVLAPGLYAWGVTVAWPASQRFAPLGGRIFALVAAVALAAGAALMFLSPILSRVFGIWVFIASCIGAWAFIAPVLGPAQLDPVQGVTGAIGWALFAISWGNENPASPPPPVATSPTTAPLPPRPTLPREAPFVVALVALVAAVPMLLAWGVRSVERALLAHAISLAAAIALVAFAVEIFEPRPRAEAGFEPHARPEQRIVGALPALLALTALAVAGAAYSLLR